MGRNRNVSKMGFRMRDVKMKHIIIILAIGTFGLWLLYVLLKSKPAVDLNQMYQYEELRSPSHPDEPYHFGYELNTDEHNQGTIYATLHVPLEAILPGGRNIFFIETSCVFGERNVEMNARQACAIESTAKMNPTHKVFFLHTCTLDGRRLKQVGAHVRQLFRYENVHFSYLNATALSEGTALEDWWKNGPLKNSEFPTAHASDVLKYLVLSMYGGTCMDLDTVTVRPLPARTNFLAAESEWVVSNNVMSLDVDGRGHDLAQQLLQEVKDTFRGDNWSWNGPELITRVMQRVCNVTEVVAMAPDVCDGITVLRSEVFNPLHWSRSQTFFKVTEDSDAFLRALVRADSSTVAVRTWNIINEGVPIHVGSRQPYGVIAYQCCPRVYSNCGHLL